MDDQHRRISGYRDLSADEIALINRIKAHGEETKRLIEEIGDHLRSQYLRSHGLDDPGKEITYEQREEIARIGNARPMTWKNRAEEHLQIGLMALTRAVAQPTGF